MRIKAVAILGFICGAAALQAQTEVHRLQDVKTIFVPPGEGQNADDVNLVTAKLISHLAKSHDVSVVETEDKADAILRGALQIQARQNGYGHASYHVQGAMRLVNKEGVVLWADDISSSPFAESATSSFAENVATRIVKALLADRPKQK